MKTLIALAFLAAAPAFAQSTCATLPANQQAVLATYNTYLTSSSDLDATLFIGAIAQYQADIDQLADKTNPNFGNDYSVDLFESNAANLCVGPARQGILERRALAGDKIAIKVVLMYSAVYALDGAGAEDVGDLQDSLLKKQGAAVKAVQSANAAFFKAHPIKWINTSGGGN